MIANVDDGWEQLGDYGLGGAQRPFGHGAPFTPHHHSPRIMKRLARKTTQSPAERGSDGFRLPQKPHVSG